MEAAHYGDAAGGSWEDEGRVFALLLGFEVDLTIFLKATIAALLQFIPYAIQFLLVRYLKAADIGTGLGWAGLRRCTLRGSLVEGPDRDYDIGPPTEVNNLPPVVCSVHLKVIPLIVILIKLLGNR